MGDHKKTVPLTSIITQKGRTFVGWGATRCDDFCRSEIVNAKCKLSISGSVTWIIRAGKEKLATKLWIHFWLTLPEESSVGKESTCSAGDPSSIPGLGRSTGERLGYPLQYYWASLVAQLGKNLPAMRETWTQSLGCEDSLEKGKATYSSILAWRIPWTI